LRSAITMAAIHPTRHHPPNTFNTMSGRMLRIRRLTPMTVGKKYNAMPIATNRTKSRMLMTFSTPLLMRGAAIRDE